MEKLQYLVVKIDGDYACLKQRTDSENEETKLVARALLPPETNEGTCLEYEWFQYRMIDT